MTPVIGHRTSIEKANQFQIRRPASAKQVELDEFSKKASVWTRQRLLVRRPVSGTIQLRSSAPRASARIERSTIDDDIQRVTARDR